MRNAVSKKPICFPDPKVFNLTETGPARAEPWCAEPKEAVRCLYDRLRMLLHRKTKDV